MKTNQKLTVLGMLVLGVLLAGFNAKAAAMPAFQGKFTLTSATRWGSATLPAGDYSFTLDKNFSGSVVSVFQGAHSVAQIQTKGISNVQSGRSEIIMEGGAVRAVNLPTVGVCLSYGTHNHGHRSAPREPQISETISVAAIGIGR